MSSVNSFWSLLGMVSHCLVIFIFDSRKKKGGGISHTEKHLTLPSLKGPLHVSMAFFIVVSNCSFLYYGTFCKMKDCLLLEVLAMAGQKVILFPVESNSSCSTLDIDGQLFTAGVFALSLAFENNHWYYRAKCLIFHFWRTCSSCLFKTLTASLEISEQ